MKSKNNKTLLALTLLAGGLASCSLEEQEIPAEELYAREFYKTFGTNWSGEGFNVVDQKSVHVSSTQPTHVKIYEKQCGEYRLAADYEDVTEKTITFDGMKNDDSPFIVKCDNAAFSVRDGGTVSYNPQGSSSVTKASSKVVTRSSAIPTEYSNIVNQHTSYTTITCESGDNTFKTLSENDGKDNTQYFTVTKDQFLVVEQGKSMDVYPVYWHSNKKHTVGIYYSDGSEVKHIPVYTDHEGDELKFKVGSSDTYTATRENAEDCWDYGESGKVSYTESFAFQSKGYKITAEKEVSAGVYVQIGDKKYYSNADMNDGISYFAYKINGSGTNGYTYLMFDDPSDDRGKGDQDFNDLVIYIPQKLTPTSTSSIGWTVACEDLGGTFDYDFNDVVFQVYYVSGQDWVRIIPLAAGGTLPACLYYTRNRHDYPISKEWHQHFGKNTNAYTSSQMINTCYNGAEYEHQVYPIYLKTGVDNFSMKQYTTDFDNAGKFTLKVKRADAEDEDGMASINVPGTAKEPQVLVLPTNWRWPKELVRINTIYPTFGQWGDGYKDGLTNKWVENIQNADQLTEDKFYMQIIGRQSYPATTE